MAYPNSERLFYFRFELNILIEPQILIVYVDTSEAVKSFMTCIPKGEFVPCDKRNISPPEDFRYIAYQDTLDTEFAVGDRRMDRFSLNHYLNWGHDSYVIVTGERRVIAGIMRIANYKNPDYIMVHMFAKRSGFPKGYGIFLERVVVEMAIRLRRNIIRVDAIDTSIRFWHDRGYSDCDVAYIPKKDPTWGALTPMEKGI